VFLASSGQDAFGALKDLLLEMAQERDLAALLPLIVQRLAESSEDVALARIWLLGPPDSCAGCKNAAVCPEKQQCLHLAASAIRSRGHSASVDRELKGAFRRIPIGAFKVGKVLAQRAPLVVRDARGDPHIARPDWIRAEGIQSFGGHPLLYRESVLGVLGVFVRVTLDDRALDVLRLLASHAAAAIASARAFDQIAKLQQRLERENEYLREVVTARDASSLVGSSAAALQIKEQIELVAPTDASVLITGESGTGKELVAEAIHRRSPRSSAALIRVNCAAVPRELYESEFFGHKKGAFSGATHERVGRFEAADGGTLFLDEVGEIPIDLQGKLRRVLQEGTFERVGETRSRRVDVRIVAATNRDLAREVAEGRFREDLFYRLSVFPIETPPLRVRREDVPPLAEHLIVRICRRMHREPPSLGPAQLRALEAYPWPGNVRELANVLERAVISTPRSASELLLPPLEAPGERAAPRLGGEPAKAPAPRIVPEAEMRRLERTNLELALTAAQGRIYGRGGAAALLGVKPTTLASRLKKLGLGGSAGTKHDG
jgi:transcriptional regulator with GAF, ATPase, and Fis domain